VNDLEPTGPASDSEDRDPTFGTKRLTPENWLARDSTLELFVRLGADGQPVVLSSQEWADAFLAVELSENVPAVVRHLYDVARAIFLYGVFFYPLYAVGEDRLYQVADTALGRKYEAVGGPRRKDNRWPTFGRRIAWLEREAFLSEAAARQWEALRDLRNIGAHFEMQTIVPPGSALTTLRLVVEDIDALFAAD
jgi:hypothetical protein